MRITDSLAGRRRKPQRSFEPMQPENRLGFLTDAGLENEEELLTVMRIFLRLCWETIDLAEALKTGQYLAHRGRAETPEQTTSIAKSQEIH